jgi:branched-chain amino acid transport system substrate-binding protein
VAAFPGCAAAQVLGDAVQATQSLDADELAAYLHSHSFSTVAGEVRFAADGEWQSERVLWTQFQGLVDNSVRSGNS